MLTVRTTELSILTLRSEPSHWYWMSWAESKSDGVQVPEDGWIRAPAVMFDENEPVVALTAP